MRITSINSMRKSKKILGRRLSIVPSSCAWVSCWFWIVMLHRSRGVLAKKTPSKLKGVQVAIANCQRSDLHQSFNKVSYSNFHRFMTVSYMWIQLWPWKPHACHACAFFQLARLLHYGTKLLSCSSVIVSVFLSLTFLSSLSFEESIAVEERDLVQVGLPTGSGTILADLFPPLHSQNFFQKIGW